ncbi:hypothetical protein IC229_25910 [Spirosoma sp. BT702]|uniref:Uncharacterized protein n=1 Tax=Spirosoma profusum TaxID=2771354 RepID=A0A926Y024_9BACT|nr:hypothetical protein [Spirosoma profusum]MBD2704108.1 hypothetical protein [Spirosoma profusum]
MKNYQSLWAFAAIIFLSLGYVVSCKKESDTPVKSQDDNQYMEIGGLQAKVNLGLNTKNNSFTLEQEALVDNQLTLPKGTVIQKIENDPHSLLFTLPINYRLTGSGARVAETALTGGKVTCKCTQGSGCSPLVSTIQKTTIGCLMNDQCGACTNMTSARIGSEDVEIQNSQVIDFSKDIHFVTEKSGLSGLKCITSEILDVKEVQEGLRKFVTAYQGKNTEQLYKANSIEEMPENYEFVVVSAYGRVVLVPVDKTLAYFLTNSATNDGFVSRARVAAESCKCNSGTSGCVKGSKSVPFLGKVVYCEAGKCTNCSLNY